MFMPTPGRMVTDSFCHQGSLHFYSTHHTSLAAMGFSLVQGDKKDIHLVLKVPAKAPLPKGLTATRKGGTAAVMAAAGQGGVLEATRAGESNRKGSAQGQQSEEWSAPEEAAPAPALAEDNATFTARPEAAVLAARGGPPGQGKGGDSGAVNHSVLKIAPKAREIRAGLMLELPQQLDATMHTLSSKAELFLSLRLKRQSSKDLRQFNGWSILGLEKVSLSNGGVLLPH
jgi:hypothetical protein